MIAPMRMVADAMRCLGGSYWTIAVRSIQKPSDGWFVSVILACRYNQRQAYLETQSVGEILQARFQRPRGRPGYIQVWKTPATGCRHEYQGFYNQLISVSLFDSRT